MIEAKAKKNCSLIVKNNDQMQNAIIAIISKEDVFMLFISLCSLIGHYRNEYLHNIKSNAICFIICIYCIY